MSFAPELLRAFVAAATTGSFSAAARSMGRSQSTVSAAIANLEVDVGVPLFERGSRHNRLTEAGVQVLGHARAILAAHERLETLSIRLADRVEPVVSLALSDAFHFDPEGAITKRFIARFPDTALHCSAAETEEIIARLQARTTTIGIGPVQPHYPHDITAARLSHASPFGVYAATDHPLAIRDDLVDDDLSEWRCLYLSRNPGDDAANHVNGWSAPDYLTLLEMAAQSLGWAVLPSAMVKRFSHGRLSPLQLRAPLLPVAMDVVWSRQHLPGPAGLWLIEQICT